jgi:hypothetical protein
MVKTTTTLRIVEIMLALVKRELSASVVTIQGTMKMNYRHGVF